MKLKNSLKAKIGFKWKLCLASLISPFRYYSTILFKRCSYGPFVGEFGHLLGHNLPFISYLHSKGVKVDFCGMEIYKPFFVDESGNSIVSSYIPIRDYFKEITPNSFKIEVPKDVSLISNDFIKKANFSVFPYWNMTDDHYYFYHFRWWTLKHKYQKAYDLSKVYKTKDEDSIVIFPRKKSQTKKLNNGEDWDYIEVAKTASKHVDKVYVIGHPAFSNEFKSFDNVEVHLSTDNKLILEKCSNSKLIISQHSGTVYLGEYTNTPILIIYKGGGEIGEIEITKKFNSGLGRKFEFNYAFNMEEINNFIKTKKYEKT